MTFLIDKANTELLTCPEWSCFQRKARWAQAQKQRETTYRWHSDLLTLVALVKQRPLCGCLPSLVRKVLWQGESGGRQPWCKPRLYLWSLSPYLYLNHPEPPFPPVLNIYHSELWGKDNISEVHNFVSRSHAEQMGGRQHLGTQGHVSLTSQVWSYEIYSLWTDGWMWVVVGVKGNPHNTKAINTGPV